MAMCARAPARRLVLGIALCVAVCVLTVDAQALPKEVLAPRGRLPEGGPGEGPADQARAFRHADGSLMRGHGPFEGRLPGCQKGDYRKHREIHTRDPVTGLPPLYNATWPTASGHVYAATQEPRFTLRFFRESDGRSFQEIVSELCEEAESGAGAFAGACEARLDAALMVMFRAASAADVAAVRRRYGAALEYAEAHYELDLQQAPGGPSLYDIDADQGLWGLDRLDDAVRGDAELRDLNVTGLGAGAGVHLYVLDTGVAAGHEQLAGRMGPGANVLDPAAGTDDCTGHGTQCAALAAGATVGVCRGCTVHAIKTSTGCGDSTQVTWRGLLEAVYLVAYSHADAYPNEPAVVSLSQTPTFSAAFGDLIANLVDNGISLVTAAGNFAEDACEWGAGSFTADTAVVNVGSTQLVRSLQGDHAAEHRQCAAASGLLLDCFDYAADFSNWGPCVNLWAPGEGLYTATVPAPTAYRAVRGTSFSAPLVAGAAAVWLGAHPWATPGEVRAALEGCATPGLLGGLRGDGPNLLAHLLDCASTPVPPASRPIPQLAAPLPGDGPSAAPVDAESPSSHSSSTAAAALPSGVILATLLSLV